MLDNSEESSLTKTVRTKRLHDLRNVEERDLDGVMFEHAQSVLQQDRVATELGEQESQSLDDRYRRPEQEVL